MPDTNKSGPMRSSPLSASRSSKTLHGVIENVMRRTDQDTTHRQEFFFNVAFIGLNPYVLEQDAGRFPNRRTKSGKSAPW